MALSDDLDRELTTVFFGPGEFAKPREMVLNVTGQDQAYTVNCIWDTDISKERNNALEGEGLYFIDVCVFVRMSELGFSPQPGQSLKSPRHVKYEIVKVDENEGLLEIYLKRVSGRHG
jgi:hypothetical protein